MYTIYIYIYTIYIYIYTPPHPSESHPWISSSCHFCWYPPQFIGQNDPFLLMGREPQILISGKVEATILFGGFDWTITAWSTQILFVLLLENVLPHQLSRHVFLVKTCSNMFKPIFAAKNPIVWWILMVKATSFDGKLMAKCTFSTFFPEIPVVLSSWSPLLPSNSVISAPPQNMGPFPVITMAFTWRTRGPSTIEMGILLGHWKITGFTLC